MTMSRSNASFEVYLDGELYYISYPLKEREWDDDENNRL